MRVQCIIRCEGRREKGVRNLHETVYDFTRKPQKKGAIWDYVSSDVCSFMIYY